MPPPEIPTILYLNACGEISGAEHSLLSMLDALDRATWRPLLAAPDGPLLAEAQSRQIATVPLPLLPVLRPRTLRAGWRVLRNIHHGSSRLAQLLKKQPPAIIHANSSSALCYLPASCPAPVIWHVRDLAPLGILGRFFFHRATRVAVISHAVRNEMLRYAAGHEEKLVLLPPSVDLNRFQPITPAQQAANRISLGVPDAIPLIGHIAQYVPWKRHHLFLDALCALPPLDWHVLLAGATFHQDTAYFHSIQQRIASPPLAGRVTLLPWQEDQARLLSSLSMCVLTSRREPFGRVLIEAMASAVPVIAVDEGGARDIISHGVNGLLCDATPEALANAIRTLLVDEALCARLTVAGRGHVAAHFSLPVQRAALHALYAGVLAPRLGSS